jgi:RNA polymerase sigma factor (sigma-70 family)
MTATDPGVATQPPSTPSRAEAVEQLFRDHNQRLLRFLTVRLSNHQEAREIAQEAYVRLLQLDQSQAIGFLRAFLFKTAANLATDRLRHRRVVRQIQSRESGEFEVFGAPEAKVAAEQDLAVLRNALEELSPRCREAFLLTRLSDLSSEEIARRVGVATRTVREYVVRATVHCRRRLDAAHTSATGDGP